MSLFGALNTSVSGLTAQSAAFGKISDNVANSQTVGYKEVDTEFIVSGALRPLFREAGRMCLQAGVTASG